MSPRPHVYPLRPEQLNAVLDGIYAWSRDCGYRGYNKHDGLNSPVLRAFLQWGKWPRLFAIQSVMRAPVNLRPLLLVPKTYNPKGLALFAQGLLSRFQTDGQEEYLAEAEGLLRLLLDLRFPGAWHGDAWGYLYPWQDLGFYAPAGTPNAVVTCFVCEAFLDAYRCTDRTEYLSTVGRAIAFLEHGLTVLKDEEKELCHSYMPLPMTMRVMDVSILIGSVMAQYGNLSGDSAASATAQRFVRYVVNRQTPAGAWYYTDPPEDSPIRHDNYHTGFILDALWRYMNATDDRQWEAKYRLGLDFYARKLFNADGAPRWMSDRDYPHDIHGAAQGILTFARHRNAFPDLAERIAAWALSNMYHPAGRFYYQQRRYYTKRFTLLRWCNGWMARALASLRASQDQEDEKD